MKYIDAERLREELQKPKTELKVGNYYLDNSEQAVGYENALIDFELLIDSLQQEQDCIVINKEDWKAQEQFKKNKDFGKPLKEEQPEVDLENELDEWVKYGPHTNYPWCTIPDAIKITAEHFYELGKNARKA